MENVWVENIDESNVWENNDDEQGLESHSDNKNVESDVDQPHNSSLVITGLANELNEDVSTLWKGNVGESSSSVGMKASNSLIVEASKDDSPPLAILNPEDKDIRYSSGNADDGVNCDSDAKSAVEMDDSDDDFGNFEEIQTSSLKFDKPIFDLISQFLPAKDSFQEEGRADKSVFLTEGGMKPMKCYNVLTADNRQYLINERPLLRIHERGFFQKSETFEKLTVIANEWLCSDKGLDKSLDDHKNLKKWGDLGKANNIFRWSSKYEKEEPHGEGDDKKVESFYKINNISQKLQNAAYTEARKIIEKRLESERKEQMKIDKIRWEREQRLIKEKQKREEELAKYNQERIDDVSSGKKKTGLFNKMFQGKSKIAKDHLSHMKVDSAGDELPTDDNDLSLKEQAERDGFELSVNGEKTKKGIYKKGFKIFGKKSKADNNSDSDEPDRNTDNEINDDDEEDDSDSDSDNEEGVEINGYNSLTAGRVFSSSDDVFASEQIVSVGVEGGSTITNDDSNGDGGGDGNPLETQNALLTSSDASVADESFDISFEDFQTAEPITETSPPSNVSDREPINLIDL